MNFREELFKILDDGNCHVYDVNDRGGLVDDVLKLIEKRIDKEINILEGFKDISSKSKIEEYDVAIKYFKGFKEMLK